jgi:hypothetical protein
MGKANFAKNARYYAGFALFYVSDAGCHSLVAPSPCANSNFFADSFRFGASFHESRPAGGGIRLFRGFGLLTGEPLRFGSLPCLEHLHEQFIAIAKVPVKTAFADAKVARQNFDSDRFDTVVRQPSDTGTNPVISVKS